MNNRTILLGGNAANAGFERMLLAVCQTESLPLLFAYTPVDAKRSQEIHPPHTQECSGRILVLAEGATGRDHFFAWGPAIGIWGHTYLAASWLVMACLKSQLRFLRLSDRGTRTYL